MKPTLAEIKSDDSVAKFAKRVAEWPIRVKKSSFSKAHFSWCPFEDFDDIKEKGGCPMTARSKNSRGFTLVEVLVVCAIISVLSGISIPAYLGFGKKAEIARAKADLKNIQLAMDLLVIDTDQWPGPSNANAISPNGSNNEVWDLSLPQAGLVATNGAFNTWDGPYLASMPLDPWGNKYFFDSDYEIDGQDFAVIGSFGPNGVGPNQYDSDDVVVFLRVQ